MCCSNNDFKTTHNIAIDNRNLRLFSKIDFIHIISKEITDTIHSSLYVGTTIGRSKVCITYNTFRRSNITCIISKCNFRFHFAIIFFIINRSYNRTLRSHHKRRDNTILIHQILLILNFTRSINTSEFNSISNINKRIYL